MGSDIICITIENKVGEKVVVPLTTWENGLKLDADWHIYVPPKLKPQVVAPVVVELKNPAPVVAPVAPKAPAPAVKPPKLIHKGKRKGK
jgi:hypothetical protein